MLAYLLALVNYIIITILNYIITVIAFVVSTILKLLPISPFLDVSYSVNAFGIDSKFLEYVGWIIPIKSMLGTLTALIGAILAYYALSIALRFIKMI